METVETDTITRLSEQAGNFAVRTYGELVGVGVPRLIGERLALEFPLLCYTPRGYLEVGKVSLDLSGTVLDSPSRDDVVGSAEALLRLLGEDPAITGGSVAGRS